jgi:hypothetical protein
MIDPELRLREALAQERRPEPGPFFAARTTSRVLAERRRHRGGRSARGLLRVFGLLLLVATIGLLTGASPTFGSDLRTLVLVPAGFGAWTFRREIAREIRGAIELLLG